ncbi:MAG: adenosine kinase [Candidatus Nanoarchaeia archaeon]
MKKKYDVIGLGSALLDIIFEVDDSLLKKIGLKKSQMKLISKKESKEIHELLKENKMQIFPGGSAANTVAGVCILGGKAAFIGKIGNDEHGSIYEKKSIESGINTVLSKHPSEITGHAITLITPDFERTFATHLGAAMHFKIKDVKEQEIKDSKILHIEGYQLDDLDLRSLVIYAMKIANQNNVLVSLDVSDAGLISKHLTSFKEIIKKYVDIVFLNQEEALAFTGKEPDKAIQEIYKNYNCKLVVVKLGKQGSLIMHNNRLYEIPAYNANVINTNGAGDMYAAGILFGLANNLDIIKSGKIASFAASKVIEIPGARLDSSLVNEINNL